MYIAYLFIIAYFIEICEISCCVLFSFKNIYVSILFSYEPELHPGVTYKLKEPKATLKIFSTGSVTVTGLFH